MQAVTEREPDWVWMLNYIQLYHQRNENVHYEHFDKYYLYLE